MAIGLPRALNHVATVDTLRDVVDGIALDTLCLTIDALLLTLDTLRTFRALLLPLHALRALGALLLPLDKLRTFRALLLPLDTLRSFRALLLALHALRALGALHLRPLLPLGLPVAALLVCGSLRFIAAIFFLGRGRSGKRDAGNADDQHQFTGHA